MSITIIIIAITCIVSFIGFSNQNLIDDLIFYPPAITNRKQWYRFITCGFIHADITHLAFNMYSFYQFGRLTEKSFTLLYGDVGRFLYLLLYLSSMLVCLLPTYFKHKEDYHYRSLGASGAVSAVVFVFVFLDPLGGMGFIGTTDELSFPAFLFGFVYLGITYYLSKRGNSYINHSAHFWGAVYGIAFLIATSFLLTDFNALTNFTMQVQEYLKAKF